MSEHRVAVITGASQGLGLALAHELAGRGWRLVLDARHGDVLRDAALSLDGGPHRVVAGDVADAGHRRDLVEAAAGLGGASLLVNNASTLGTVEGSARPQPRLAELDAATYRRVLEVNLVAPVALATGLLTQLREHRGTVVNVSSDAAVEAYAGWGAYGSSKAALAHVSRVLAAEEPALRVQVVDPGDMRTAMHQDAFPGEDISDRPEPDAAAQRIADLVAA